MGHTDRVMRPLVSRSMMRRKRQTMPIAPIPNHHFAVVGIGARGCNLLVDLVLGDLGSLQNDEGIRKAVGLLSTGHGVVRRWGSFCDGMAGSGTIETGAFRIVSMNSSTW